MHHHYTRSDRALVCSHHHHYPIILIIITIIIILILIIIVFILILIFIVITIFIVFVLILIVISIRNVHGNGIHTGRRVIVFCRIYSIFICNGRRVISLVGYTSSSYIT